MNILDKFQPMGPKMLVEPFKVQETSSGIVAQEMGSTTPVRGKIIVSGKWSWRRPWILGSQYRIGETVFFRRYSVDELKFVDEKGSEQVLFLVEDSDVVGKIKS